MTPFVVAVAATAPAAASAAPTPTVSVPVAAAAAAVVNAASSQSRWLLPGFPGCSDAQMNLQRSTGGGCI